MIYENWYVSLFYNMIVFFFQKPADHNKDCILDTTTITIIYIH